MKFGGTSIGGAAAVRQAVGIVAAQLERKPVVVVSAHVGVTDSLLAAARDTADVESGIDEIVDRHRAILRDLNLDARLLDALLDELRDLGRGLRLVGAVTPKLTDVIASYGERLSARVVAAALTAAGMSATPVDSFRVGLRTDSKFGRARPAPDDELIRRSLSDVRGVPVVTGFLGADEQGNITTLGRNGSDFSAALIGAAIGAEEVQIWTDVDGVHTADPRIVPAARSIRRMSFADVADLASFGSTVLHPAALEPLRQAGIPLRVRSTLAPAAVGTTVASAVDGGRPVVRAIAHRDDVAMITLRSQRLVPQHAFLSRVFRCLDQIGCDTGPVAVGEAAVTIAVETARAELAVQELASHADVDAAVGRAVVGIIGDAALTDYGGIVGVLGVLERAGVTAECAGLGSLGSVVAFSVTSGQLAETVQSLHRHLFSDS